MMWSDDHLHRIRAQLLGKDSDKLIQLMLQKSLMAEPDSGLSDTVRVAEELEWLDASSGSLTTMGRLASDSCREYAFWLDRNKALPFEGFAPHLTAEYFRDRNVMEIGSGMGANLLSLSAVGAGAFGIEPVAAYRQMGAIFSEREGLPIATVHDGQAEQIPFADDHADLVLCVSTHQYFDIHPALSEIKRVLRPGGELIIIGGTIGVYCGENVADLLRGMGQAKAYIITVINTLSYMSMSKRLLAPRGKFSTSRPIYPSQRAMQRWLSSAGMTEVSPLCRVGRETCFHYALEGRSENIY